MSDTSTIMDIGKVIENNLPPYRAYYILYTEIVGISFHIGMVQKVELPMLHRQQECFLLLIQRTQP